MLLLEIDEKMCCWMMRISCRLRLHEVLKKLSMCRCSHVITPLEAAFLTPRNGVPEGAPRNSVLEGAPRNGVLEGALRLVGLPSIRPSIQPYPIRTFFVDL